MTSEYIGIKNARRNPNLIKEEYNDDKLLVEEQINSANL